MDFDKKALDDILKELGNEKDATIPILQAIQSKFNYIPPPAIEYVSKKTGIPEASIYGVATFYAQFKMTPQGKHLIKVCHGTACHVADAMSISETLADILKISPKGGTTEDKYFTVQNVACLGCCSLAPVMMIDDKVFGKLTRKKIEKIIKEFRDSGGAGAEKFESFGSLRCASKIKEILVGMGSCGIASGAGAIFDFFKKTCEKITVKPVGCMGMCHMEPMIEIVETDGTRTIYRDVDIATAKIIVAEHISEGKIIHDRAIDLKTSPYLSKQRHIVLENCGRIDPENIKEYEEAGGYVALKKVLNEISPDSLIEMITKSGLRGRGGAGFLTGLKWKFARSANSDEKYIICNADEGDPGAFMDRSVLESDPHRVLEGMIIASFAIGATKGYIYCRAEYPLAIKRLKIALEQAQSNGYLGKKILGSSHSFDIKIKEGAGAFVCGEETAMIASIEGNRGMPRLRPPFPAQSGIHSKPTNINNVETFANVLWIINHGSEKFAAMGTEKSKGSKVFALAGDIKRGGLVEVPMGITLKEIVNEIGGGTSSGLPVKAIQLGGPSGGCIPSHLMDTIVDYDAVQSTGAIMGSGGMVVMDESNCMVDIAKFFLNFTQDESCGKCTFCRIGTRRMLEILERISDGRGKDGDIELLEDLSNKIKDASLCGLGQTAPNPVLTTIKYFRSEYEAHIKEKKCTAGKCRALITYAIIEEKCIACGLCIKACSYDAIVGEKKKAHVITQEKCTRCGACVKVCPTDAIIKR